MLAALSASDSTFEVIVMILAAALYRETSDVGDSVETGLKMSCTQWMSVLPGRRSVRLVLMMIEGAVELLISSPLRGAST